MGKMTTAYPKQKTPLHWLVGSIVAVIAGSVVAVLAAQSPALALVMAFGLPVTIGLTVLFFFRPTLAVWLVFGLLFLGNRTEFRALYFWGRYLPTIGIGVLVSVVLARQVLAAEWRWTGKPVIIGYALFTVVLLLSAAYNGSTLKDIALSLGTNLRYPLFFVALLNANFKPKFYQQVIKAFVAFTLLQIPVSVIQFASGLEGDWLSGTMGHNAPLVAVVSVSQCILLARWLTTKRSGYLLAVLALVIPILVGDVRIGLIFLPLLVLFMMFRHYGFQRVLGVLVRFVIFLCIVAGLILVMAVTQPSIRNFLSTYQAYWDPDYYTNPLYAKYGSIGRLTILPLSVPLLLEDPVRLIWGFGPEAAQGGTMTAATFTESFAAQVDVSNMGIVCQRLVKMNLSCREPQIFKALMEFGLLGTVLYLVPMFTLWDTIGRQLRHQSSADKYFMWLIFQGVSFWFVVLAVWYIGVWRMDSYSFPFWFIAAAAYTECRNAHLINSS